MQPWNTDVDMGREWRGVYQLPADEQRVTFRIECLGTTYLRAGEDLSCVSWLLPASHHLTIIIEQQWLSFILVFQFSFFKTAQQQQLQKQNHLNNCVLNSTTNKDTPSVAQRFVQGCITAYETPKKKKKVHLCNPACVRKGVFSTGDIHHTLSAGDSEAEEKIKKNGPLSQGPFQRVRLSHSIKWH